MFTERPIMNLPYLPVVPTVRFSPEEDAVYFDCYCCGEPMDYSGFILEEINGKDKQKLLRKLADEVGDMLREEDWVIQWVADHYES